MKTRFFALFLALIMISGMFAGCSGNDAESSKKGPSDKELIEEALENTTAAVRELDVETAIEYILDGSGIENALVSVPEEIEEGIELINKKVSDIIDGTALLKLVGSDTRKLLKETVADGLQKGKLALLDSAEVDYNVDVKDSKSATAEIVLSVGGKKFLPLINSKSTDKEMDIVMDYVDELLKSDKYKGESLLSLPGMIDEIAPDIVDAVIDDIKNGEKEEIRLEVAFEKTDGKWLITDIKGA